VTPSRPRVPTSHRDLLRAPIVGVLTTLLPDGLPHSALVWLDEDAGEVRLNTTLERQSSRNLRRDPRLSLLAVDPADTGRYVQLRGDAELVLDGSDRPPRPPHPRLHLPSELLRARLPPRAGRRRDAGRRPRPRRAHHPRRGPPMRLSSPTLTPRSAASGRVERAVLVTVVLGTALAYMSDDMLNLATPAVARDLGASMTEVQWILNAYYVVLVAAVLVAGALGDRIGHRRVFARGLVAFTAGGLVCAAAPTICVLTAGRAVEGLGAAMVLTGGLALVTRLTAADRRNRVLGTFFGLTARRSAPS
jgi:PPOX class probable F420-dependent enzyme